MSPAHRNEWIKEVAMHGLGHLETFEATYDLCCSLIRREIPGDFVECGVYAGAQCAMMAAAICDLKDEHRCVSLFDSFEGIPLAGPEDQELKDAPAGIAACSLERVRENFAQWGLPPHVFAFFPGYFDETITPERTHPKTIAMLRLDGDLYRSTKPCLDVLLPRVSRGGWVVVDDFNLSGCRQAVLETMVPAPIYWRMPTK